MKTFLYGTITALILFLILSFIESTFDISEMDQGHKSVTSSLWGIGMIGHLIFKYLEGNN